MPSLAFVVPVYGRLPLARICLRQLGRTCDSLAENGIHASAVVVGDDSSLDVAADLGFATVRRDNEFVSRKFNDGIQLALERPLGSPSLEQTHGEYDVCGRREYRAHAPGTTFAAKLDPGAEQRAVARGDIRLIRRFRPSLEPGSWTTPDGWNEPFDYVVPCGSDDWVDWRLFIDLPAPNEMYGFQRISFVREDGLEITSRFLRYDGGCGIRIYPRQVMERVGFRPAEEDLRRGCDTSILVNLRRVHGGNLRIFHIGSGARQIVDFKSPDKQLNTYQALAIHQAVSSGDPFDELAEFFPAEALSEMRDHYATRILVAA